MPRESYASLRLPADLKSEVQAIAVDEHRTFSSTVEILMRMGIAAFQRDGILRAPKLGEAAVHHTDTEDELALAHHMADLVAERILNRLERMEENLRPKPKPRSHRRVA